MVAFDRLTDTEIAQWRLHTQRLVGDTWSDPVEVVRKMLCVQAENFSQSGWALAARCDPAPTESDFHNLFDDGHILRTHVIRPTWHYVVPDDIVWLTELTGPRIKKSFISAQQQPEGISDRQLDHMVNVVVDAIAAEGPLTRDDVGDRLTDAGLPAGGPAVTATMGVAESSALVCSGPRRHGSQTYALVRERAPGARRLERDDAVAELTRRYIGGHAPVTERDLSYWASLTLTDVRKGLEAIGDEVTSFDHNGLTYWCRRGDEPPANPPPSAHILQILDEMYRGYHVESRWVLDVAGIVNRGREKSIGMVLVDAQVVAGMSRRLTETSVEFAFTPFRQLTTGEMARLRPVADAYGRYCGRAASIVAA